jgi:virulence factor Mce-like protein
MMPARNPANSGPSARTLAATALAVAGIILLAIVLNPFGGGSDRIIRARFASVEQLTPGLEVRIAGRKVGKISSIALVDGSPVVSMRILESDVWPLPSGTTAEIRWGSTTSLAYRYLELHPGPPSGAPLPNDALLAESHTSTPVELDQYYRIFRGHTQTDVRQLLNGLAQTLNGEGSTLRQGLAAAPGGVNQTSAVLAEMGANEHALDTLITQGERVTGALANRQNDLGGLVDHLAGTFDEFAQHTQAEQASLDRAPQALDTAAATLRRLDTSLSGLQGLVNDIAPGATRLQTLAPSLRGALVELYQVAPLAASTLQRGTRAASPLTRMLTTGTTFLPRAGDTFAQLAPMFACLRPYTPELAGNMGTWTGYNDNYDKDGHYARTFPLQLNPALAPGTLATAAQAVAAFNGGLHYAMPRPPGLNAGNPWFQPQCGAGPNSLDPAKDPEAGGS